HAPVMQRARSFWREQLRGAPARLAWPAAPGQALVATGAGRRVFFPLDVAAVAQLEEMARAEKATPFVAWLAMFGVLLGRWTRQLDIVVGSPLAQRERAELQGLIGFFLNTLPLRLRMAP